ncbi:hypothetical protein HBI37_094520 [Parastagonospora nodorum]|nr:hypothetical protein HBI39_111910 [Parastagonospora nodorum]KAH6343154.1 hypothetical protein HBI37_094520 [Parastagonospora nodorum]KAH6359886.1 hypothetical protein HBI36_072700 [Parastagonospora nodorum]
MAATTRARTGNSKPRLIAALTPSSSTTKAKANTSKPRDTKVAKPKAATGAGVVKAKKPRTKTEKVVDKIVGTGEKVVGDVTGKPGKKAAGTRKARGTDSMKTKRAPRTKKAVV